MADVQFTAIVLGSGQDGGVPQFGTAGGLGPQRSASSVAVVGSDGSAVLMDASPDLRSQYRRLVASPEYAARSSSEPFDAVLLTHAHMGHYTGLVHFGKEARGTRAIAAYGSPSMLAYLDANEPWASLFAEGHLRAVAVEPGETFEPIPGLRAVGHAVPHRPDHSDNVGFELTAPSRGSLLYLPDLDRWDAWPDAHDVLARVDTALIDATFYDEMEHPDRDISTIPHPPVTDTIDRFGYLAGGTRLILTHLNWTNRLCDPAAPEQDRVRSAGFGVAHDGMRLAL
jgi:pyrroloquinoline quinone biosynthesis protein B